MNLEEINPESIQDSSFDDFVDDIIEYDPDYSTENVSDCNKTLVYNFNDIADAISAFRCKYCNFIDNSIKSMIQHYQTHMSSKERIEQLKEKETIEILVCSICYGQHKNVESLKEHMINSHGYKPLQKSSEGKDKCDEIKYSKANESKKFDRSDEKITMPPVPFKDFKTRLRQSLTYKCPLKGCCYKFETKEKQEQHIKCHISSKIENIKSFKCLECSKELKCWRECTDHMWKTHKIDIDLFSCPICSFKATFSIKVWRHMKSHPKWKSKVLRSSHHWNINKDRSNPVTNRWYSPKICEVCSRPFSNSKTLSKHVKAVHNKIKPFICNVCGRKSARKSTWVIHMRQHTGEKPYQCKICSYRASDPSVLRTHEKRHTKEATYKCKSCEYTSIQPSGLKLHVKVNHPEDYKQLQCDQCNYISVSVGMLEFHKKDHKKGLISNEDSQEASRAASMKMPQKLKQQDKSTGNVEISSDCFLPLESTDSLAPDPSLDTGGVTIPANSEDTQFPFIGN